MKHVHLFEKYSHYEEAREIPNFIGYHCSKFLIYDFNGLIEDDSSSMFSTYGKDWYRTLLEELGWTTQLRSMPEGLSEGEPKLEKWYAMVNRMLSRRNIHWIFVATDKPHTQYGQYEYAVSIDPKDVLFVLDDKNEISSEIYVYNSKKVKPIITPLFDMPEKPKPKPANLAFTPDKSDEGLGLFKRSERYRFPWELTEREYRNDIDASKYGEPYPYYVNVDSERLIYQLLGIKPFSISQYETFCHFKEYMDGLG